MGERLKKLFGARQENQQAKAQQEQGVTRKKLDMPDGRHIIVASENDEEVHVNIMHPKGGVELKTLSRADYNALSDELEAPQSTEVSVEQKLEQAPELQTPEANNPAVVREDGSKVSPAGLNEVDLPLVRIENPDGEVEEKVVSHQDLKDYGLPNPAAQEAEPAKETVESLRKQLAEDQQAYQASDKRTDQAAELLSKLEETNIKLRQAMIKEAQAGEGSVAPEAAPVAEAPRVAEPVADAPRVEKPEITEEETSAPESSSEVSAEPELSAVTAPEEVAAPPAPAEAAPVAAEPVVANATTEAKPAPEVQAPKETLQEKWTRHMLKFGTATDAYRKSPEGRAQRAEMDRVYDELHSPEGKSAETLEGELVALVNQFANVDPNSPEGQDLQHRMNEAYLQLRVAELNAPPAAAEAAGAVVDPNAPMTPEQRARVNEIAANRAIPEAFRNAEAVARERRLLAEQRAKLTDVETAFRDNPENHSVIKNLEGAQARYAKLKAKSETWGSWGRKKREVELTDAEQALKHAEIIYARSVTDAKVHAGLLEGSPEELRGIQGEQLFGTLRQLAKERRTEVRKLREKELANPNLLMKALGGLGKHINSGSDWRKRLTLGGAGAAMGVGAALWGAGWPITLPLSTGIGLAIRGASTVDNLNKQVAGIGVEGVDRSIMTDAEFREFMDRFRAQDVSLKDATNDFSQNSLNLARAQGHENADAARKDANKNLRRYTTGFILGGGATLLASNAFNMLNAGSAPASPDAITAHPNEGTLPSDRYPTPAPHEFARGADRITDGEGWFSQFRDMGMSDKEAHALFGDDNVMKQLVEADAAYPDDSARIGGYGINMPEDGRLSEKAMEIIGKAMDAKGY